MASLLERTYNPDVLTCLANLSNDEVLTPPELANQVLDLLPDDLWRDPSVKILDPFCKSGVFLREAAKRFIRGLEDVFPDLQERVDHVMHEQLFGIAITEMTALLSRRSLYCSKFPNGRFSVSEFDGNEGNIRYRNIRHTWRNGKCVYCGASKEQYDRDEGLESHAYEFIHTSSPEEIFGMKFDVIVGNPPYQLSDGGNKASATPLYNKFVETAKRLNPRFITMIIPSRWFDGGRGLSSFRRDMLSDDRLRKLIDYQESGDAFPGVDVAGGVCYFLWERDYHGLCEVTTLASGESETAVRRLNEFPTFIRSVKSLDLVKKIRAFDEPTLDEMVSSQKPYGLRTYVRPKESGDLVLRWNGGEGPYPREEVPSGQEWIDKWKVFISYLTHDHAGKTDGSGRRRIISVLEVASPKKVCTETYLSIGSFASETEANNLAGYLRSKFARFFVLTATSTQHLSKSSFCYVPSQDFTESWSDEKLYGKYGLTTEEVDYIESRISPMEPSND